MADRCTNPTTIKESDLSDYLFGIAPANVMGHIANCVACQKEVAELQTIHAILDEVFYESECPDEEELLAYQAGFLPRSEQKIIEQHLPDCLYCTQFVGHLQLISDRSEPLLTRIMQTGKRILSAIFQPTQPQPALALLGDEEQQQIYQAGQYQIMLTTSIPLPGSNLWEIEGHIVNHSNPQMLYEGHVTLLQDTKTGIPGRPLGQGGSVTSDEIDEFGFFALEDLAEGRYTLHIELSNAIIPIHNFTIKLEES